MPLNIHPETKVHVIRKPFVFDTPYKGRDESIPQLEIGYEAWGDPANPAILICHALSGNCHATDLTDPDDSNKSWWGALVGPGRVIDTNRYYVICVNMLGGCGGSSGPATINPDTGQTYGLNFPMVTIHDMVRSQRMMMDELGVKRLHAVVGGSTGGFQALVWGILYPDFVERVVPVATTAYSNQFMIATNRVQIDAIQMDANYNYGNYTPEKIPDVGMSIARMVGFTTFISPVMMERKFAKSHQSLREPFRDGYFKEQMFHEAERYLRRQSEDFPYNFDANSMVYLLQTWNHFDLARKYGNLAKAMETARTPMMLIAATGDNLFPPYLSEDIVKAMNVHGHPVQFELIDDDYGHDFFLIPEIIEEKIAAPLAKFMES